MFTAASPPPCKAAIPLVLLTFLILGSLEPGDTGWELPSAFFFGSILCHGRFPFLPHPPLLKCPQI